jgi:hypothetical protein
MDQTRVLNKTLREIKDTLGGIQGGISSKQFSEILGVIATYLEKPKGDKGDKGDTVKGDKGTPGKHAVTPKKGKDYYTKNEKRALVEEIYGLIHTPQKGLDYYTKAEKQEIIDQAVKIVQRGVYTPTRGVDYMGEEDLTWIDNKIKEIIPELPPPVDTSKFMVGVNTKTLTVSKAAPLNPAENDLWVNI